MTLQVVTANRLRDGAAVYLTADDGWSEWLAEARAANGKDEAAALLATAERHVAARLVVAPYLIDVVEENGRRRPVRLKELIRAKGPTTQLNVGKQAVGREALHV